MKQYTEGSITNQLEIFLDTLEKHVVFDNWYFKNLLTYPWNKDTYELHRANFFYRTELTVKAIAHVCSRSAMADDQDTLMLFSHILDEECGKGNPEHCHSLLMEQSHNLYGSTEFEIQPLSVKDAKNHYLVIDSTQHYRDKMNSLINCNYHCMLGVVMALEIHADKMLMAFREAFRYNVKKLDVDTYKDKVEIYFNCHVDNGVEDRHAKDAKQCVINNCNTSEHLDNIKYGALGAMNAQLNMWNALNKKFVELNA